MKSKSQIVLDAEWTYQDLNLKCLDVIKELKKVQKINYDGKPRNYTIPEKVLYVFCYDWNGKTRTVEVLRKTGNPKPLTTNIRTEIAKQLAEELKQMEGFTKNF